VHRASGYRQFQIKVGADWQVDIDRIRETVPLLQSGEKAMADANQGWRVDNAIASHGQHVTLILFWNSRVKLMKNANKCVASRNNR